MCPECNHDDHEAGRCKNCNCGESELVFDIKRDEDQDWKRPKPGGFVSQVMEIGQHNVHGAQVRRKKGAE